MKPYDWSDDARKSYDFWREWKGLQHFRGKIIAALKWRVERG